jgi:hypothetical protein
MPSYEDVTQRAGSLRAMTGFTAHAFQALLPPFEHAFEAYLRDRTIAGQPRTSRATVRMTRVPYPREPIHCSSC